MVLGIPSERRTQFTIQLKPITNKNQWWTEVFGDQAAGKPTDQEIK
jgi:hypothetical protein